MPAEIFLDQIIVSANGILPHTNNGCALGSATVAFADLFLATGGVINWNNGQITVTQASGVLTIDGGSGCDLRVPNAGTNTASVVTIGATQTLTGKTLTSPAINSATISGGTINNCPIGGTTIAAGAFTSLSALRTTEQLRLSYDVSNYASFTVSSAGNITIAPTGGITVISGELLMSGGSPTVTLQGSSSANFRLRTTGQPTDNNCFDIVNFSSVIDFRLPKDDYSATPSALKINRSGTTCTSVDTTGNLKLTTVGTGLFLKQGTNATFGRAQLVGGTCTVNTTKASTTMEVFLTNRAVVAGAGTLSIGTVVAGTSFVINSTNGADSSSVSWMIVEPS